MKCAKKWISLFLASIVTAATPLSALAAWEDALVRVKEIAEKPRLKDNKGMIVEFRN